MGKIILKLGQVCIGSRRPVCRRLPHNMSNQRMFWATKNQWRDAWQEEVYYAIAQNRQQLGKLPLRKPKIELTAYVCRLYDPDNLSGIFKPLIDQFKEIKGYDKQGHKIAGSGLIVDDSAKYCQIKCKQKKVARRQDERVEIIIN